jgi:hypothetical protein
VQAILAKRGSHPGLVAIFLGHGGLFDLSARAQPADRQNLFKADDGQCLHYYFYFLDEELGLTYVRVPTWRPCRLQIYVNGHNGFAAQLGKRKIAYQLLDNALVEIGHWNQAQRIADDWKVQAMQRKLHEFAQRFCPMVRHLGAIPLEPGSKPIRHRHRFPPTSRSSAPRCQLDSHRYPRRQARQHRHFLGKKLNGNYQDEMGNRYTIRIEGTGIKPTMGSSRSSCT